MYYKLVQDYISNWGSFVLLEIRANVVTNWGSFIITNWDKCCYKLEHNSRLQRTPLKLENQNNLKQQFELAEHYHYKFKRIQSEF